MKLHFLLLLFFPAVVWSQNQKFTTQQFKEDFNFFWTTVNDEYCYFDKKQTDWDQVKALYAPIVDTITTREQFVSTIERALYEIYDHHASLNTNTDLSSDWCRLVRIFGRNTNKAKPS